MTHFKLDIDYSSSGRADPGRAGWRRSLRLAATAAWVAVLLACAQTPPAAPAQDSASPEAAVIAPLPDTPVSAPVVAVPTPLPAAPAAEPAPLPMPQAQTQTTPPVAPKPAALVVTAKLTPGYYVNVGAFAVEGNANKAYQRLQEAGMTAVAQTLTQRKRTLMRVGAGPFPTRAAAQAAAKKIALIPLDTLISKH